MHRPTNLYKPPPPSSKPRPPCLDVASVEVYLLLLCDLRLIARAENQQLAAQLLAVLGNQGDLRARRWQWLVSGLPKASHQEHRVGGRGAAACSAAPTQPAPHLLVLNVHLHQHRLDGLAKRCLRSLVVSPLAALLAGAIAQQRAVAAEVDAVAVDALDVASVPGGAPVPRRRGALQARREGTATTFVARALAGLRIPPVEHSNGNAREHTIAPAPRTRRPPAGPAPCKPCAHRPRDGPKSTAAGGGLRVGVHCTSRAAAACSRAYLRACIQVVLERGRVDAAVQLLALGQVGVPARVVLTVRVSRRTQSRPQTVRRPT